MDILLYLIPLALFLSGIALGAFFWTLRSGQYDDLEGTAFRILMEDDVDASAEPFSPTKEKTKEKNVE